MSVDGDEVALGVTGSVAAYKAVMLARLMIERGWQVWPVLTPSAQRFVGALSFSSLCGRPAITDLWTSATAGEIGHVEIAHRVRAVVIAPCTADALQRLTAGRANDPLGAIALSTESPLVIAPAMESGMWNHPATQSAVEHLVTRGATIVPPQSGPLASGRVGVGRMAEPEVIVESLERVLAPKPLAGTKVLVTAGPTREAIDPVRFLSNPSTGKMGFALARVAHQWGADVTLVAGPVHAPTPLGVRRIDVTSTEEMLAACRGELATSQVLIMAAAPADFRPQHRSSRKTKKSELGASPSLSLVPTPDILKTLRAHDQGVYVVGFAAESHDVLQYAHQKLQEKNLDLLVANDITAPEAGFGVDTNIVTLLSPRHPPTPLGLMSKVDVAKHILRRIIADRSSDGAGSSR